MPLTRDEYKTPVFPLDRKRAERFVVDFDELIIEEPEEQPKKGNNPKPPVKGRRKRDADGIRFQPAGR